MKRVLLLLLACLIPVAAVAAWSYFTRPVLLSFVDFPDNVATVDLGQNLTVKVAAKNDGGMGVTWTCSGDACGKLTTTSRWATFYASGLTGTATLTATSKKRPSVHISLIVTVHLNATPTMLCDRAFPPGLKSLAPPADRRAYGL